MDVLYCANCQELAVYVYRLTKTSSIPYCFNHLPKFLKSPQYVGSVVKASDFLQVAKSAQPVKEATAKSTKKKSAPVVESAAVVEEAIVVEEPVVEELQEDSAPEVSEDN
jgi:hypothetical protein